MFSILMDKYQNDIRNFDCNFVWCTFSHCKFDAAVFTNIHTLLQEELVIEPSTGRMVSNFKTKNDLSLILVPL